MREQVRENKFAFNNVNQSWGKEAGAVIYYDIGTSKTILTEQNIWWLTSKLMELDRGDGVPEEEFFKEMQNAYHIEDGDFQSAVTSASNRCYIKVTDGRYYYTGAAYALLFQQ